MGKIIELTHDDVQNELAYALICETMEGAYWNSGRRRRMFSKSRPQHNLVGGFFRNLRYNYKLQNKE